MFRLGSREACGTKKASTQYYRRLYWKRHKRSHSMQNDTWPSYCGQYERIAIGLSRELSYLSIIKSGQPEHNPQTRGFWMLHSFLLLSLDSGLGDLSSTYSKHVRSSRGINFIIYLPDFSIFATLLITPTATVCLISRTAKRPRGG